MAAEIQALNRAVPACATCCRPERLEQQHVVLETPEDEDYVALTSSQGLACAVGGRCAKANCWGSGTPCWTPNRSPESP